MKTPAYWNKKNIIAKGLLPIGKLYEAATSLRLILKKTKKVSIPVICIGNITAGGTGKTPVAIAITKLLQNKGYHPFFVSRGYGGKLNGIIVNSKIHSAKDVGDEPLILTRQAPVSINHNRFKAAKKAMDNGADIIVMDDGFQNPSLYKDLSFLVFDGGVGLGNNYPIPAGPLRENLNQALKRANAVLIIGNDQYNLEQKISSLPVFKAKIISLPLSLKKEKVIAFAGIGRPNKFYNSLQEQGIKPIKTIDFPDHHFYSEKELKNLITMAKELNADLVTTAKDFVKIPPSLQTEFNVLEISVEWENKEALNHFIFTHLSTLK